MSGILITSLDFELFWGMLDCSTLEEYGEHVTGGRTAIPKLLDVFKKYNIHATWATVGFMFANNYEELKIYFPDRNLLPTYDNEKLNSYKEFQYIGKNEQEAPCFYAPSLIELVSSTAGQEIGSHTFSHYYCQEAGQSKEQFRADMEAAKKIAADKGFNLKSVILPRNQCRPDYTEVLKELGFTAYRDEENDWIHEKVKVRPLMRILRLMDVYFPLTGQGGYRPKCENGIWNFLGSRMYKPFFKSLKCLEKNKVHRIKKQMLHAAKKGLVFHLWWHPHNIGVMTEYHLKQLDEIFSYYSELRKKYGMQSLNMAEATEHFSKSL